MAERTYAEQLALAARVTEPAIRAAIAALRLPAGSHGLDAGCGIGTHAAWLAEATGSRVTGLDVNRDNLATARRRIAEAQLGHRIALDEGSLFDPPYADGSFDWLWCADTLWPVVVPDPVAVLERLRRLVRPGGTVALSYWSSQQLLPGYPQLEARLGLAFTEHTHYCRIGTPDAHHLRALGWLQRAGLVGARARTFVAEHQAPLSPALRESLAFCFEMLYGELEPGLSADDRAVVARLCRADSPECVLDVPGYHAWITYTVFDGRRDQA
ncbi:MAG: class I SAM-dependent methyltransferase [Deltaproteobacteria bacterium]|nr:class I SAM-dependent methyltransferase [Deltaproteobacteria bacterium]